MSFALTGRGSHVWTRRRIVFVNRQTFEWRNSGFTLIEAHGRRRHSVDRRGGGGSRISSLECAISAPTGNIRNRHAAYARPYGGNEPQPKRGCDGPDDREGPCISRRSLLRRESQSSRTKVFNTRVASVVGSPVTVSFSSLGLRTTGGTGTQTIGVCDTYQRQYSVVIIPSGKVQWSINPSGTACP